MAFKRSLGIQYDGAEVMLRRFDRFVAQTFKGRRSIDLKVAIEGWLQTFQCRPVTITNNFVVISPAGRVSVLDWTRHGPQPKDETLAA